MNQRTRARLVIALQAVAVSACDLKIDVRDYITQSGLHTNLFHSISGYRNGLEWLSGIRTEPSGTAFISDFVSRQNGPPYLFGVRKSYDTMDGWRCFADPGAACLTQPAAYPPQAVPLVMELPVLSASALRADSAPPGATLIPEYQSWRAFDVHQFDPATCAEGPLIGTIWHKVYAFLLDSYDFKGDLGLQIVVFGITEVETDNPGVGGERFETYLYARGWGRGMEQGYDTRNPSAGVSLTLWNLRLAGGYSVPEVCPLANLGAW